MGGHGNVIPQDRMNLKGEHLEHHFRWGLSELGIVVVVMGSSMLENRPLLSSRLLGEHTIPPPSSERVQINA